MNCIFEQSFNDEIISSGEQYLNKITKFETKQQDSKQDNKKKTDVKKHSVAKDKYNFFFVKRCSE